EAPVDALRRRLDDAHEAQAGRLALVQRNGRVPELRRLADRERWRRGRLRGRGGLGVGLRGALCGHVYPSPSTCAAKASRASSQNRRYWTIHENAADKGWALRAQRRTR